MIYINFQDLLRPEEIVGILAGLFVLGSFLMKGEIKIRFVNLLGAILFVTYGILIGSLSVSVINGALVIVQIYYLIKYQRSKKNEIKPHDWPY